MNKEEKKLKEMLDNGRELFTKNGLTEELDLYCDYYVDKGMKPTGILFSEISKDEFGYIAFTDDCVTILPAKAGMISGVKWEEPKKISYSNIKYVEAKGFITLIFQFTNGEKYKLDLITDGRMFIIIRIFEKLSQKLDFYNNVRNFERIKESYK